MNDQCPTHRTAYRLVCQTCLASKGGKARSAAQRAAAGTNAKKPRPGGRKEKGS